MNFLAINNFKFNTPFKSNESKSSVVSASQFGIKMTQPLKKDEVSFKATVKVLNSRTNGVRLETAKKIHKEADLLQEEIEKFIRGLFKDVNCIQEIKGRTKTPESIVEKSATRNWNSKDEIFREMTDLNGVKIILNDSSRKSVHKVLDVLEKAIENGFLILTEVENKRPIAAKKLKGNLASKWDYSNPDYLSNLVDKAQKHNKKPINFVPVDYTQANYPAIHFLFRLPGQKRVFELQLMGKNVSKFKDLDDLLFKILNNKNVDKKYAKLKKAIEPILLTHYEKNLLRLSKIKEKIDALKLSKEEVQMLYDNNFDIDKISKVNSNINIITKIKSLKLTEADIDLLINQNEYAIDLLNKDLINKLKKKESKNKLFNNYRAEAFLFQRDKKISSSDNSYEYFLPLREDLPMELDFNNLYKIYKECLGIK